MVGRKVSHFSILEEIGQGGMGKVYLAQDQRLDRRVALKFLGDQFQDDPLALKRFLREAKSAAGLDHPFICSIFEVGEGLDGPAFISMEYVSGETLDARLKRGLPDLRQALRWALEISEALHCAHDKSLVHRDLKPANLMITSSGHIKVMDFGLAKRLEPLDDQLSSDETLTSQLTRDGATPGTLAYMSPEQLKGRPLQIHSDLFAFGIIFHQMLTGTHPFQRSSPIETASAILKEEPLPLSRSIEHCPPLLEETLRRMLAKDPQERFGKAEEISQRLSMLLDDTALNGAAMASVSRRAIPLDDDAVTMQDVPSGAETLADQPQPAARRRPWAVAALAAAALLAILLLVPGIRATLGGWLPVLSQAPEDRLAILPFDNFGTPGDRAAVLQGLAGALTRRLSQMPDLQKMVNFVPASQAAGLSAAEPQEVWEALRSSLILGGSLHLSGEHLWLTANLIDARQGRRLQSATLDVAGRSASEAEEDLANQVAELLRRELTARKKGDAAAQADKTHYQLYQDGMALLERYDRKDNIEKAVESFQLALERNLDYAPAHAGLAEANWRRYRRGRDSMFLDQALTHSRRAVELDTHLAMAHVSLGLAEMAAGDWQESEAAFDQALKLDPSNAKALYGLGLLREAEGRSKEGEALFKDALAGDADNWDALTELGALYYGSGRYEEARSAFERTIELRPDSHIGYRNLGGILMLQGDLPGAAANFQKSLEIRPEATAYSNLGTLQFFRGLYAESASAFEKAIQLGAGDYLIWANLGDAYRQLPQSSQKVGEAFIIAIQKIREELKENPQDSKLLIRLALYQAKNGQPQQALQTAQAVRLDEVASDLNLSYLLLQTYELAGERDKALDSLSTVLQAGYPLQMIRNDPELAAMREDARFHRIVSRAAAQGEQ